jgi:2'-5' RNA ligase
MSDTIRTFIAFELPDAILAALDKVQRALRPYGFRVRWARSEGIHLTLKFLGDIKAADIEPIAGIMSDAAKDFAPFSLTARAIGVFPSIKRPRVIWSGLAGDVNLLEDLQQKIDASLTRIGFIKENRPFRGHLTLGRFQAAADPKALAQALQKFGDFETESFAADRIILFQSELEPTGAVYSKLKSIAL